MEARNTDPRTSQRFADGFEQRTISVYNQILALAAFAADADKRFTDSWLTTKIRESGRRIDRNVVARVRLTAERDGWLERAGQTNDKRQLLFRMRPAMRQVWEMSVRRVDLDA